MKEERNKPEIRFKGFDSEWSKMCMGQCFTERLERSPKGELISVTINKGVVKTSELNKTDNSSSDKSNYKVVNVGDLAYNSMRMWQGACGYSIYKGICSPAYTVVTPTEKANVIFFSYMFKRQECLGRFRINSQGLTSDTWNLRYPAFSKIVFSIPTNTDEQKKIGDLFNALDSLIRNLELKLEKLRHIKQSLLDLMFVDVENEGQKKPRIRFIGFEGEWEKNILNYYLTVSSEKNQSNTYNKYDIYSVSREYGVINQIEYQGKSFAGASLTNYGVVKKGDVVYTKSPLKNQPYGIIKTSALTTGIVSALYGVYHPLDTINSPFVHIYFELDRRLNNYLRPLVNKGAKNTLLISDEDSIKGNVIFPNKDEQEHIIVFIEQIDLLIREQEVKLEKSRNIKQSLLQKMFV